jgi:hypothetical protein
MNDLSFRRLVALAVSMAIAGCAPWQTSEPVTPASYEVSRAKVSRTVGKLRRLVVLRVDQAPPKACGQNFDGDVSLGPDDPTGFVGTLITDKGYEVIVLDEARFADLLGAPGRDVLVAELLARLHEPGDGSAGPATSALLERLREDDLVDGLLVLGSELTCLNANAAMRGLYSIGTLGMHAIMPNRDWQQTYPTYRVMVFETTSARVVWRNEWNAWSQASDYFRGMASAKEGPLPIESLLEPLEPAVPKVLTR